MKLKVDPEGKYLYVLEATHMEHRALKNYLNRYTKTYRFDPRFKLGIWDGKVNYYIGDGRVLLGLWKEVLRCCQELGYSFNVINKEDFPINRGADSAHFKAWVDSFFAGRKDPEGKEFFPRDYQVATSFAVLKNRYCLVEIATAGGKSLTFSMLVLYLLTRKKGAKVLLVVPTITLVTQFYDDLNDYNNGFNGENKEPVDLDIMEVMGDKPRKPAPGRDPNVYIGTYQSLSKYPKAWFKQFDVLAMDEAHTAKNKSVQYVAKSCDTAYYRYGMSGTFPHKDTAELLSIMSVTGPIIDAVKAAFLMEKGVISDVKIKAVHVNHNDPAFHDKVVAIRRGDGKNAYDVEKQAIQKSEKRLSLIAKIAGASKSNMLVLFNNKTYGAAIVEAIRRDVPGARLYYIDGNVGKDERNRIKKEMERTDTVAILVASYGTLSTGVSIKAIANVILAEAFKSEQRVLQSIGRALRLHAEKEVAVIFDLIDRFIPDINTGHIDAREKNPRRRRNIFYDQWIERRRMYKREQYPVTEMTVDL